MKHIILIIVAFVATATSITACGQTTTDTLKTTTIQVSGITCNGDMPLIKKKLINKEGIDDVAFAELKNKRVSFTVKYHPSVVTEKQIREWIESAPSCDNPNLYPYKTRLIFPEPEKQ